MGKIKRKLKAKTVGISASSPANKSKCGRPRTTAATTMTMPRKRVTKFAGAESSNKRGRKTKDGATTFVSSPLAGAEDVDDDDEDFDFSVPKTENKVKIKQEKSSFSSSPEEEKDWSGLTLDEEMEFQRDAGYGFLYGIEKFGRGC